MMKFVILAAGFSAIALGSYVFVRGDSAEEYGGVSNATFISAPMESVTAEPVEYPTPTQNALATSNSVNFALDQAAPAASSQQPLTRPAERAQLTIEQVQGSLSEGAFNALTAIESIPAVRVQETNTSAPTLDLSSIVARSLAQSQGGAYVSAVDIEAKDERVVVAPTQTMFANTLISETHTASAAPTQTTNAKDAAYLASLSNVSAPPKRLAQAKKYKVRSGDNLSRISFIHYGRTSDYITIFQANRDRLKSPNRILVGQMLLIPAL